MSKIFGGYFGNVKYSQIPCEFEDREKNLVTLTEEDYRAAVAAGLDSKIIEQIAREMEIQSMKLERERNEEKNKGRRYKRNGA